jgi:UDP-glucose 4-epimerase
LERRRSKARVIFNLAGEISHIHSMEYPERDLQINALAEPRFLQECARASCGVRVVYAGTRQIYGVPEFLPVDESHLISPEDFNGIHKYAAMMYPLTLSRMGHAVVLQLANVYGPQDGLGRAAPRLSAGVFPQASAESTDRDLWRFAVEGSGARG